MRGVFGRLHAALQCTVRPRPVRRRRRCVGGAPRRLARCPLVSACRQPAPCLLTTCPPRQPAPRLAGGRWIRAQRHQQPAVGEVERLRGRYLDAVRDSLTGVHLQTPTGAGRCGSGQAWCQAGLPRCSPCMYCCCSSRRLLMEPPPVHAAPSAVVVKKHQSASELEHVPFNPAARARGNDWPLFGLSMSGTMRLDSLRALLEDALRRGVPGSFVGACRAAGGQATRGGGGGGLACGCAGRGILLLLR